MKWANIALTICGVFLLGFLATQIYRFWGMRHSAEAEFMELKERVETAQQEYGQLEADMRYLSRPENQEKEMRARFPLKSPDEKLIILVPTEASSSRP